MVRNPLPAWQYTPYNCELYCKFTSPLCPTTPLPQLRFLEPFLRNAELTDAVRLLYKGTLRVLLVLLHDFPEFLCEFHFHLCDVIPPSCIQVGGCLAGCLAAWLRAY